MKSLEKCLITLSMGDTVKSKVIEIITSWLEHLFSVFSFDVLNLLSCKQETIIH